MTEYLTSQEAMEKLGEMGGKNWGYTVYAPRWYNGFSLFRPRLFALESFADLNKFPGKNVLINGALIFGLYVESKKSITDGAGIDGFEYRYRFDIKCFGSTCIGTFKSFSDPVDLRRKQGGPLLIIGKASRGKIKDPRFADAMIKDKCYDNRYLRFIHYHSTAG
jgi:hypothetical protein